MIYPVKYPQEFLSKQHTIVLKGLAIIIIILSHMANYFGIRYFTPLGGIGVSIFLVLSGYGITESYLKNNLNYYWIKKIIRVWVPYLIVQIIALPFHIQYGWWAILLDVLLIHPLNPLGWYMNYLFLSYLTFYIVFRFGFLRKHNEIVFLFIAAIVFYTGGSLRAEQALSFFVGILLSNRKKIASSLPSWKYTLIFLIIGFIFLGIKQIEFIREVPDRYYFAIQLLIKLPIAISLILFTYKIREFNSSFFVYMGKISFELYLVHGYWLKHLAILSWGTITIFFVLSFTCAITLSKFCKAFTKKYKMKLILQYTGGDINV